MGNLKLFSTITTYGKKVSVLLEWITVSSGNEGYFTVEKSKDGKSFKAIGKVRKEGKPGTEAFYLFVDDVPRASGFYRLKDSESNSRSNIAEVSVGKKQVSGKKQWKKTAVVSA